MIAHRRGFIERALAFGLCMLIGPLACVPAPVVAPAPGLVEYRVYGLIAVSRLGPAIPGGLECDPFDSRKDVDPIGRKADLDDGPGPDEVGQRDP